jgi:spore germination protein KA
MDSIFENICVFQGEFDQCSDFILREFTINGNKVALMMIDNMIDKEVLTNGIITPLTNCTAPIGVIDAEQKFLWIRDCVLSSIDEKEVFTIDECISQMTAGFVIFLYDGVNRAISIGLQGYKFRSIEEPKTEQVLRGSREGFVEPLRINLSLLRRRIRNPNLKFVIFSVGKESKTDICLSYIKGIAADSVISEVIRRINSININTVLDAGYIQTFMQDSPYSIFSTVGTTERPDSFCGKLNEGSVGLLIDGSPQALIMPQLFVANFQNFDDYAVGTYYATFTRVLKYAAFIVSFLLPAFYVAVGNFHLALMPTPLLYTLAQSEESTPFPLVGEALIIQIIYEMLREAGLRLPRQFGFAITIVGSLIIGQAAVSAGIIGAPMVIIVALTATTSLVVPSLYEPGVVLRFALILLAGMSGFFGMTLGLAFVFIHICSLKSYDVPYTAPISPFDTLSMRDVVVRAPWKILSRKKNKVQDMPGSDVDKTQN